MAARRNLVIDAKVRERIKTSQLVNRLQAFGLGENDPKTKKPIEMTGEQVRAALGVLKKTLPDLNNVEVSGDPDAPVKLVLEWASSSE